MNQNMRACRHLPLLRSAWAACFALLFTFGPKIFGVEPIIITSASKQFIVRGRPVVSTLAHNPKAEIVYLDPALLAVTCERVKQTLAKELGWDNRWRGTIFIDVHPLKFDNEQPELHPFRTTEGWRYRVSVPDEINRTHLLETIVEALLTEFADRSEKDLSAELPPWLAEGLTAYLINGPLGDVALQANAMNVGHRVRNDPVDAIRDRIREVGSLSIDQLNWADFDENDPKAADAYHQSAHLFVRELLKLRGGPDAISAMLAELPEHLNWQTAFLRAFDAHFHRMVDVEKWWALRVTQMKTRDSSVFWANAQAQQKFEEILYTPMQVSLPGEEPHMAPVALQTVINEWDFKQQAPLLQTKLKQLQMSRVHLGPEIGTLVDGYYAVLAKYLTERSHPRKLFRKSSERAVVAEVIQRLNALDEERKNLPIRTLVGPAATKAVSSVREAERLIEQGVTQFEAVPLTPH